MGFWVQYKALLSKNWILWKRNLLGSLIELLLPIGAMLFLGIIRQASKPENEDAQTFSDQEKDSYRVSPDSIDGNFPFNKCIIDKTSTLMYSIISEDKDFINYMKKGINQLTLGRMSETRHKSFNTISDFDDSITDSDYEDDPESKLCFGVYLKKVSTMDYELKIRYNITETIYKDNGGVGKFIEIFNLVSNTAYNDLIVSPTPHLQDFYDYGFLSLMNLADNYFLQQKASEGYIQANFYPMRFDDYIEDGFLAGIDTRLVFFLIFPFMVPICRFLAAIVSDKENRTKEIMMMMGLHSSAYWLSWITYYLAVYTAISIAITIIVVNMGIFPYSNTGLLFLYFWLYSISCISFSILVSVFFSKAKIAVLVGIPLFLCSFFISFGVSDP